MKLLHKKLMNPFIYPNAEKGSRLIFTGKINPEFYVQLKAFLSETYALDYKIYWAGENSNSPKLPMPTPLPLPSLPSPPSPPISQTHAILTARTAFKLLSANEHKPPGSSLELIEEHSYILPSQNRYILTKSIIGANKQQLANNPYVYNIEMIIHSDTQSAYQDDFENLRKIMAKVNPFYHLDIADQVRVNLQIYGLYSRNAYFANLINKKIRQANLPNIFDDLEQPRMLFLEKLPLSLMEPVVDLGGTVPSQQFHCSLIFQDDSSYAITDKADGERTMLFIDSQGKLYFTGFNLAKYLEYQVNYDLNNCLFDGELVTVSNTNTPDSPYYIYLIFDCLFWQNQSLLEYPLLPPNENNQYNQTNPNNENCNCRFNHQNLEVLSDRLNSANIKYGSLSVQFKPKRYHYAKTAKELQTLAGNVYQMKYPYQLDGLIFVNKTLSLPEMLVNRDIASFRWKPADRLSVDLLVRVERDEENPLHPKVINDNLSLKLYTRNNANYRQLDLLSTISVKSDANLIIEDNVVLELIKKDGTQTQLSNEWIPVRNRPSKTIIELYDRTDKINNIEKLLESALDLSQLMSWPTTNSSNPKVSLIPVENTCFYFADNPYREFIRRHYMMDLINFNNMIKYNIILKEHDYGNPANYNKYPNYLDLACGRCNDLFIWNNQVKYYLGLDIDEKNIESCQNFKCDPNRYQFAKLDLRDRNLLSSIRQITNRKFDIVSMQFAVHYLTDKSSIIDALFKTVSTLINKFGHFIISGMDGKEIFQCLQNNHELTYSSDHGDLLWKIEAPTHNSKHKRKFCQTGQEILFTMTSLMGLKPSLEYLINFDYLNELAQKYGFRLIESQSFGKIIQNDFRQFTNFITKYCTFQRYKQLNYSAMQKNIITKPYLYELAKLYRYSIWQKM